MSRARNIKPGFFKNELLVELPFEVRILFIGLWTMADREGRLEDRPVKIKMEIFPADNIDVNAGLQALNDKGFILRYEVDGIKYIQVLEFTKHQNPHVKEAASTIPAPCKPGASTMQASEIPERAGLIPDSLLLIPDSLIPDTSVSDGCASEKKPGQGGREPSAAPPKVIEPSSFDRFWAAYPEKIAKPQCKAKWKSKNCDRIADQIIADVVNRRENDGGWAEGYTPHPLTYLNQERWTSPIKPKQRAGPTVNGRPSIAQNFASKTYTGTPDDELPEFLRNRAS